MTAPVSHLKQLSTPSGIKERRSVTLSGLMSQLVTVYNVMLKESAISGLLLSLAAIVFFLIMCYVPLVQLCLR